MYFKRSPHLVPYSKVDEAIKKANRYTGVDTHSLHPTSRDICSNPTSTKLSGTNRCQSSRKTALLLFVQGNSE